MMSSDGNGAELSIRAEEKHIANDVRFGTGLTIEAHKLNVASGAIIESGVTISGEEISIGPRSHIQRGARIFAEKLDVGFGSRIEEEVIIKGMTSSHARRIWIGDNAMIGTRCRIMVPVLKVGDYVKVHNHTLINGRGRCAIGHNTWVGQNNILNAEDDLVIGNNVGFGIYSSIWTHAYYGELLEGCTISQVAPITVDDDVWLVGAYNAIAPGVHVGKRAVILNGSFVNKDVPPKHVVGGSPARDLTDHVVFYRNVSLEEKMSMMKQFTREFLEQYYPGFWLEATPDHVRVESEEQSFDILFWEQVEEGAAPPERYSLIITKRSNRRACANASVFDLEARTYTKRLCEPEIQLISFLNSHRARFVPYDHPKIELEEDD